MTNPTLLILAAGTGSRYRGMKVDEPLGPHGESILNYSIYDARRAGFDRIIFVIRPETEKSFRDLVKQRLGRKAEVEFVFQKLDDLPPGFQVTPGRVEPWGTTHAILSAAKTIHAPLGVINAGDFYGTDSYRALANHLRGTTDCAVVAFILRNTLPEVGPVARAVCYVNDNGFLDRIRELKNIENENGRIRGLDKDGRETALHGNELVSMNMWGFTPHVFELLAEQFKHFLERKGTDLKAECYIPDTMDELLERGRVRVKVLRCADSWFGLTYREDCTRAAANIRHLIEAGYYPRRV